MLAIVCAIAVIVPLTVYFEADATTTATFSTIQPGTFNGKAFDACTAPSTTAMSAWKASPYKAVGIYIGGSKRGCAQPALTADWVRTEVGAGWHLIPIYVGVQAPCQTTSPTAFSPTAGQNAATDAIAQAKSLGLAAQSAITYDMEGYPVGNASCTAAVQAFLSNWTSTLHAGGYLSGFYSSMSSGVADEVAAYSATGKVHTDFVDFAHWDNVATTTDAAIPSADWPGHRRMKQYAGGHVETYGGVSIDVDSDYADFQPPASARQSDFDRDGWSDVLYKSGAAVVLAPGDGNVISLAKRRNLGGGNFASATQIIRIGDLNRDGLPDVISRVGNNLYLYPGKGTGLNTGHRMSTVLPAGTRELTPIGDLNKDGYPDMLAIVGTGLRFYPGAKGEAFGTPRTLASSGWGGWSELAGVGDFDNDGYPDLAARTTAGVLYLMPGKNLGFKAAHALGTSFANVRDILGIGDFDRDGYTDIAGVDKTTGDLMLWRGNGSVLLDPVILSTGFTWATPLA